jgi:hypothetical protein
MSTRPAAPGPLQVGDVKARSEPVLHRCQQRPGRGTLPLFLPQPGEAHGGGRLLCPGLLAADDGEGLVPSIVSLRQRWDVQISVPEGILHREPLSLSGGHQTIIAGDIRTGQSLTLRFLLRQRFL